MVILVSSANSIDLAVLLIDTGRSLLYIRKSKGPNTGPCGTPHSIIFHNENDLFKLFALITALWYLLLKYDFNSLKATSVIP